MEKFIKGFEKVLSSVENDLRDHAKKVLNIDLDQLDFLIKSFYFLMSYGQESIRFLKKLGLFEEFKISFDCDKGLDCSKCLGLQLIEHSEDIEEFIKNWGRKS